MKSKFDERIFPKAVKSGYRFRNEYYHFLVCKQWPSQNEGLGLSSSLDSVSNFETVRFWHEASHRWSVPWTKPRPEPKLKPGLRKDPMIWVGIVVSLLVFYLV